MVDDRAISGRGFRGNRSDKSPPTNAARPRAAPEGHSDGRKDTAAVQKTVMARQKSVASSIAMYALTNAARGYKAPPKLRGHFSFVNPATVPSGMLATGGAQSSPAVMGAI